MHVAPTDPKCDLDMGALVCLLPWGNTKVRAGDPILHVCGMPCSSILGPTTSITGLHERVPAVPRVCVSAGPVRV